MAHDLVCWKCGASLAALSLPLRRLEECPACRAELHVCRMCRLLDPQAYQQCRIQEDLGRDYTAEADLEIRDRLTRAGQVEPPEGVLLLERCQPADAQRCVGAGGKDRLGPDEVLIANCRRDPVDR